MNVYESFYKRVWADINIVYMNNEMLETLSIFDRGTINSERFNASFISVERMKSMFEWRCLWWNGPLKRFVADTELHKENMK